MRGVKRTYVTPPAPFVTPSLRLSHRLVLSRLLDKHYRHTSGQGVLPDHPCGRIFVTPPRTLKVNVSVFMCTYPSVTRKALRGLTPSMALLRQRMVPWSWPGARGATGAARAPASLILPRSSSRQTGASCGVGRYLSSTPFFVCVVFPCSPLLFFLWNNSDG